MVKWTSAMENMVNFWKNKKVLITGHTGFKGSWLSLWLHRLEAHVVGFSLSPPTTPNLFTEAKIFDKIIDIRGDVRDYQHLHQTIIEHQPEIIFHLAAQSLVLQSYTQPLDTYATNVMGTVHLLEAARHYSTVRAIVNVTTDKCYENKEWHWAYRENEPIGGYDPYSSSKACSELITAAYRNSFFNLNKNIIGIATARAGNVIGGGDWAEDRLIPDIISAYMNKKPLKIRYPHAIRPWQHVLESLSGYLLLAEKLYNDPSNYSEAWNFGPGARDERSVKWIIENSLALLEKNIEWSLPNDNQYHEATFLKLDCSKAKNKLGWLPKWNVSHALNATIAWYKNFYQRIDVQSFCLEQIETYTSTVVS